MRFRAPYFAIGICFSIAFFGQACATRPGRFIKAAGPISLSPDGNSVAMDCQENGLWSWDLTKSKVIEKFLGYYEWTTGCPIQFADTSTLAIFTGNPFAENSQSAVRYVDVAKGSEVRSTKLSYFPVFCVIAAAKNIAVISPDSKDAVPIGLDWIVAPLTDGMSSWRIPVGRGRDGHAGGPVLMSRDGKRLAVAVSPLRSEPVSELWDLETRTKLFETRAGLIVSLSGDGTVVAVEPRKPGSIEFWEVNVRDATRLGGITAPLGYVHLFPDGKSFLAQKSSLEIWDVRSMARKTELISREMFKAHYVAISDDGSTIATSGKSKNGRLKILIWNSATYERREIDCSQLPANRM